MSDFFDKLKRVFVVPDTTTPTESAAKSGSSAGNSTPPTTGSTVKPVTPTQAPVGNINDKFMELLLSAMEAANQPGFDYIEYKRSVQTLEQMPMDEKTRYFSAFAAAQSMGVSKQKLIESANFYASVLRNEELKFQEATKGQRERQIGGKEGAIAALEKTIQQKGEQIAQLTQQIQQHQAEMEAMKAEISEAVVKIETTMNDFTASYEFLANQIEQDRQRMEQFLN